MNGPTGLNPNAEEFVPSFLKYAHANVKSLDSTLLDAPGCSGKANLDQSNSSVYNASSEEAHRCWQQQLPIDITPDYRVMVEEGMCGPEDVSLAGLSIHDDVQYSRFSSSLVNNTLSTRKDSSPAARENFGFNERTGHNHSVYAEDEELAAPLSSSVNSWGKPFLNGGQHSINRMDGYRFGGNYNTGLVNEPIGDDSCIQDFTTNPVEYLSEHFPSFAPRKPVEVYCTNRCDLGSTIENLNKLKLQVDDGSKFLVTRNLDFPGLPDAQTGSSKCSRQDTQRVSNAYRTSSSLLGGSGMDFASAIKKRASYDTANWRLGAADGVGVGSSRSSQLLASSQSGHGRMNYGDKLHGSGAARAGSPCLEIGEVVGSREDACLRIACFEQAREGYLVANNALAKDPSLKGHVYNMQMKAAYEKPRETNFRERNFLGAELHSHGKEQDLLIDLRCFHANEAIKVLINRLSILRSTARSTGQRLQVWICIGTGLHTKSSLTPAVLAVAVEQYLFEQGLNFTQPQPGLLRVVIC